MLLHFCIRGFDALFHEIRSLPLVFAIITFMVFTVKLLSKYKDNSGKTSVFAQFLLSYAHVWKFAINLGDVFNTPDNSHAASRHLLVTHLNCTPRSIEEFPPDFMTLKEKRQGGVIVHIFLSLYMFAALAVLCDDYFVASLECLCDGKYLDNYFQ